jgi:ACR3 family arsenite efflux pump ArsB
VVVDRLLQIGLFAALAVTSRSSATHADGTAEVDSSHAVAVFFAIPLLAAIITGLAFRRTVGERNYRLGFIRLGSRLSLVGSIFTATVLFASQVELVVAQTSAVLWVRPH